MEILFPKFPQLEWNGRQVIWDTRQEPNGKTEIVFLCQDQSKEIHQELLKRQNAIFEKVNRRVLSEISALACDFPSSKLCVVGITGTNGKTTSASTLAQILALCGHKVCEIGTLGIRIWTKESFPQVHFEMESGYTTPEGPQLQSLFAQLIMNDVTHVVMEVSSHALTLGRVGGVDFDIGIFTNLSQDHLDFHKTMNEYKKAKSLLFSDYLSQTPFEWDRFWLSKKKKTAIANVHDPVGQEMLDSAPQSTKKIAFALGQDFKITKRSLLGFTLQTPWNFEVNFSMIGDYNAENISGVLCAAVELCGENALHTIQEACKKIQAPPGRMESVPAKNKFVFVDYAHTPDALVQSLKTLRALKSASQRLWVVFGCGGDRDPQKRPIMGQIASENADKLVVCSDNPRTEDPNTIIQDIVKGIPEGASFKAIENRREAIRFALKNMSQNDICLIAGKGHENYQIIGKEKKYFSDKEEVQIFFKS